MMIETRNGGQNMVDVLENLHKKEERIARAQARLRAAELRVQAQIKNNACRSARK